MKPVLICTPTWNKAIFLGRTLISLRGTADQSLYRHIVIDNGSWDDTKFVCKKLGVERIPKRENGGVAQALNTGLRLLKSGQYFMKLDDDVEFSGIGWLKELLAVLEADESIGGIALPRLGREQDQLNGEQININGRDILLAEETWWTNCALYSYDAMQSLGSFWQPGLYGYEDLLTGIRLRKLGWKVVYLLSHKIDHFGSWRYKSEPREYRRWKSEERDNGVNIEQICLDFEIGRRSAHIALKNVGTAKS